MGIKRKPRKKLKGDGSTLGAYGAPPINDDEDLAALVHKQGKINAMQGHPPSRLAGPYIEGYEEGMQVRADRNW